MFHVSLLLALANDRQFYEEFWAREHSALGKQLAIHTESRRPLLKLLEELLPVNRAARFLEVGCGTALDSCLLLQRSSRAQAVAVDLSANAAVAAQRNAGALGLPLRVAVADLTVLPFPADSFDLVFSQGVLEHFEDPTRAMHEQLRVLRSHGVLVVDVPQKFNVYTLQKRRAMKENRWPWGWETEYSVSDLRGWAGRFNLQVVGAIGHQHGRIVDRLLIHPHRMIRNTLSNANGNGHAGNGYRPGALARSWEAAWDWMDAKFGPYLAINVAVAYRKADRSGGPVSSARQPITQ